MKRLKKYWQRLNLNWKFTISILVLLIIPMTAFCIYTFRDMEQSAVEKNVEYMQSVTEKSVQTVSRNVESVNMATLIVTQDEKLKELLQRVEDGDSITTDELRKFYSENIEYLQRMLNSNPSLYAARIFDHSDSVQEMVPILYRASRMKGQQWSCEENPEGWYFEFPDSIFQVEAIAPRLAAMITQIDDYIYGRIATVEVSIEMEKLFPDIYDESDDYYGCFIDNQGHLYCSDEMKEADTEIAESIGKREQTGDEIQVSYEKCGNRNLVVSSVYLKSLDGTLVLICDITDEIQYAYAQSRLFAVVLFLLLCLLSFAINRMVKSLLKRLYGIVESIRQSKNERAAYQSRDWGEDEIGELGNHVNVMVNEMERLLEENYRKNLLAKNAELKALHSQINAHFLYNVLGAINMIAEMDGEEVIANAVTALGDMMHYSLKWDSEKVELSKEIKYIRDYIALTNIRYDHQILLQIDLPEEMSDMMIPKMTLQPIVENSVKHGLGECRCDTVLEIRGFCRDDMKFIEITDQGKGIPPEQLKVLRKKIAGEIAVEQTENGHGVAMHNIQERLSLIYGNGAGLEIESREGEYTKVIIKIPERIL